MPIEFMTREAGHYVIEEVNGSDRAVTAHIRRVVDYDTRAGSPEFPHRYWKLTHTDAGWPSENYETIPDIEDMYHFANYPGYQHLLRRGRTPGRPKRAK